MKTVVAAMVLSGALGFLPALAQEKKQPPAKEGMPMKKDMPMQEEGIMLRQMKGMQGRMSEMR